MKIPNKLKVGGHTYKVIKNHKFTENTKLWGQTDNEVLEIRLDSRIAKSPKAPEIFIHEMLHCIDHIYNGSKLEEDAVERLSEGLYQVLKDNGMLK